MQFRPNLSAEPRDLWTLPADWPFRPPPTYGRLVALGLDPNELALLGLNESPVPPGSAVTKAAAAAVSLLNRYPDNIDVTMSEAVSRRLSVSSDRLVWGAGAGDLIFRSIWIAAKAGASVVAPSPTFWGYERVYRLTGAKAQRVPLRPDGGTDIAGIISAISPDTGIVSFATPGNPSGALVTAEEIEEVSAATPAGALLLVDEVYHEFAPEGAPDIVDILQKRRKGPWLVLRSFSKAFRMAGARVGFGIASDATLAKYLQEHALNFMVSSIGFAVALAAWEDRETLQETVRNNQIERAALGDDLRSIGLQPLSSAANFVSVPLPSAAAGVLPQLMKLGIACGQWSHPDFPNHLRVGVGTAADRRRFIKALKAVLGN
ncbi:MAG: pyridoxal phosphate-dependent aminotransferase [Xanthobacteraceae bacterium]